MFVEIVEIVTFFYIYKYIYIYIYIYIFGKAENYFGPYQTYIMELFFANS